MGTWVAKNRTIVMVTAVVLVAAYASTTLSNDIAPSMFGSAWGYAIPLVLAALVGVIGERSGVVNIGIEGQMLLAAFAGFFAAATAAPSLVGVLAGVGSGLIARRVPRLDDRALADGPDHRRCRAQHHRHRPDVLLPQVRELLPGVIPNFDVPLLSSSRSSVSVFFCGRSSIATARDPRRDRRAPRPLPHPLGPAHPRGRRVPVGGRHRGRSTSSGSGCINVTLAGSLAGCAGVYLSMDASSSFERNMTAGRGFLALAIMIMGAWRPLRAFAMALFFGFVNAVASQLQQTGGISVPPQLTGTLPYVVTLVVLASRRDG